MFVLLVVVGAGTITILSVILLYLYAEEDLPALAFRCFPLFPVVLRGEHEDPVDEQDAEIGRVGWAGEVKGAAGASGGQAK